MMLDVFSYVGQGQLCWSRSGIGCERTLLVPQLQQIWRPDRVRSCAVKSLFGEIWRSKCNVGEHPF